MPDPNIDPALRALQLLLTLIGLPEPSTSARVVLTSRDAVVPSANRYAAATAAALGAYGAAIAAFWALRTGRQQEVEIDERRAVLHGLRSVFLLRQSGHGYSVGGIGAQGLRANNFFMTRDGRQIYLLRMFDYPHLVPALLGVLRCPNTHDDIAHAVSHWDAFELEDALARAKAVGVVSRSPREWLAHPQGQWLAERPGVEVRRIGDSAPEPFQDGDRPLSGIRVLDASHVIAGPATGRTLAEQGAQVLRISAPYQPDPQQMVIDLGFGKRSAFIDLNHVEDARQLRELAMKADVFIESWRPGAMERRGFSPEDLMRLRPGIVYVSLSCYGSGGPWRERAGYEPIGQAATGLSMMEGGKDHPALAPTVTMNDYLSAYLAAAGVASALVRRAREGGSYHVSTSLAQSSMWVLQQGAHSEAEGQSVCGLDSPTPANWMSRTESAFGLLEHCAPVTQFSETPGFWACPPQPLGAAQPVW
ncbi:CoA transferase [Variovorax sp. J22P168]|uniref:CoA transferase n=1 Tax=Variovorax jilinensis TaxID=3053513 RepID=UPI002575310A|nr:CoA transferase [Variovorax sp. J22P168]MDM0014838.1 CoA transferase [Variovorax sp. J22P168]